jgi:tRNA nucleotidyltransferase (CCA-adding enzyme)
MKEIISLHPKNGIEELHQVAFPTKEEYLARLEAQNKHELIPTYEKVLAIAEHIKELGGRALLVGGSVRDHFFQKTSKDFDLEVYGIDQELLRTALETFGSIKDVGKAFGISKVFVAKRIDIDVSIPRKDSKVADGHNGFEVVLDPTMSIEDAAKRRDFTINTLAADPLTGELFDHYGGLDDIKNRILRVTDCELFKDDPLRVVRGMQFAGRFGLSIDPETVEIMKNMTLQTKDLPKSRLLEEWTKLLTKPEKPSIGLMAGQEIGYWQEIHPEFVKLMETPQDPEWHPEGDVWVHTLMVVDQAAIICKRNNLNEDESLVIMLAALNHDIAKPEKTFTNEQGRIVSPGHEQAGGEPAEKIMRQIGIPNEVIAKVVPLIKNHMAPSALYRSMLKGDPVTQGAFKRLASRLHPATISELVMVCESDSRGRGPYFDTDGNEIIVNEYVIGKWLEQESKKARVYDQPPEDIVWGRDLIAEGFTPGKDFGKIISLSNKIKDLEDQLVILQQPENLTGYSKDDLIKLIKNLDTTNDAITTLTIKGIDTVNIIREILKEKRDHQQ